MAAQDTSTIAYLGDYGSDATADLAADHQRGRDPAGQPRQPLRRAHLLARRRPGRAGTLLPERQAQLRAAAARRPGAGRRAGPADALARRAQASTCSTTRTPSRCRSATLVGAATPNSAGITVAGARQHRARRSAANAYAGEVEKIVASKARGGVPRRGRRRRARWRCGSACTAPTRICCCSARARWPSAAFTSRSAPPPPQTYLTTPLLAASALPAGGPGACWPTTAATFDRQAGPLCALRLRGDERRARRDPPRRRRAATTATAVIERFFATHERDSVLGRYSIAADGETTLSRYGVDRVSTAGRSSTARSTPPSRRRPRSG